MAYKVVSISPQMGRNESPIKLAQEMEGVISKYHAEGWEYMQVETLETWIAGTNGCFGFGAQPGFNMTMHFMVFKK